MPTFSRSLEQSLHRALALANERHHEYATLEHLLLALIDDQDAAAVMRACNVDLEKLKRDLTAYSESELDNPVTEGAKRSLGVSGWAANRSDGSVEAVLEGERERVDSVVRWCGHGPRLAHHP